jgi:tetratricopeptide (TPR) repeat protein
MVGSAAAANSTLDFVIWFSWMTGNIRSPKLGSVALAQAQSSAPDPLKGALYQEGEYWVVELGGKIVRIKEAKGLTYLSYLLRHPGMEFHVLDLAGGIANGTYGDEADPSAGDSIRGDYGLGKAEIYVGGLGDAGELLDDKAKIAYRRRASELLEELEEARSLGKAEHAEQLEEELDALTGELTRAVDLRGRNRRAASASERARQTVTKAIRTVIERVAQKDAAIGNVFSRCIKTGTFCRYQPDPDLLIAWEFTAIPAESFMASPELASADRDGEQSSRPILGGVLFSTAQRTPFVGRDTESSAIRSTISHALPGNGSVIMLSGGAGVGKTRLAIEIAEDAARSGSACFLGRCYERDDPVPYLPFVQIIEAMLDQLPSLDEISRMVGDNGPELAQLTPCLRRVFPHTPDASELPPAQKRHYLFQSVAEALQRAARTRPQLLILDDLQWADESTLALLIHLANRLSRYSVVIIGTYRDEYSDHPALARTIEELLKLGVRPLKLSGLSRDSVAQMLEQMSERQMPESLVNTIFRETNGNPFFIEEMYRHLAEERRIFDDTGAFLTELKIDEIDVPANVRLCIIRRLNRFSADEMRVLSAAAVLGRSFSFQLLAAISEAEVDDLFSVIEKAQRMAIMVPSAEGPERPFTFSHELVRQTLLGEISIARRQKLHAKAAQAVESQCRTSAREYAGEIADHLLKAGAFAERDVVIHWLFEAGNAALEVAAFEEARANLEAALSRLEPHDSRTRAELLFRLGIAQRGLARWEEAYSSWEQAFESFTALNDQEGAGRTCLQLAEAANWTNKRREAYTTAEHFLAEASIVSSDRALLLAILALSKLDVDETDAAGAAFTQALALAEELHDGATKGAILAFRSQFNFLCLHLREALDDSLRSAELIDTAGPWIRAQQLLWYQITLLHLGRVREGYKVAQELQRLAVRIGHIPAMSMSRRRWAWVEFWQAPNLDQLENELRRDIYLESVDGELFFASTLSSEHLGTVKFLRGNWGHALIDAEAAWSMETRHHVQSLNVAVRFRAKAYSGDRGGALKLLRERREMLARSGRTNSYGAWALLMAAIEGLYVLGEGEKAATLYPLARELIATDTIWVWIVSRFPQTIGGIAAAAAHSWDTAEEHFQIAMKQAESFPNVLEQADIRRFRAMMLMSRAATSDRERARALLNEALRTYQHIGMPGHAGLTRALLGRTYDR